MGFFLFLVYLAAFLLRPSDLVPILGRVQFMDLLATAALVGTGFAFLAGRRPSPSGPVPFLVVAFVIWSSLTVIITQSWLAGALRAFAYLGINLSLFVLAFLNVDSLKRVRITAAFLVCIAVVLVAQGALAVHLGLFREHFVFSRAVAAPDYGDDAEGEEESFDVDAPSGARAFRIKALGYLNDPNDLAQMLVSVLPLVFAFRRERDPLGNLLRAWLPAAFITYGVYLTHSRGALLTLAVLFFLAVQRRLPRLLAFVAGSSAFVAVFALAAFGGSGSELDESAAGRIYAWHAGIQMLKASPIWGVGFLNFSESHELLAHNSFIHCAAEVGLVGYFLWLSLLVIPLVDSLLLARVLDPDEELDANLLRWLQASRLGLVGFLIAGFFLSRAYSFLLFLLVGLSTALAGLAGRDAQAKPELHPLAWTALILLVGTMALAGVYLAVRVSS